MWDSVGKGGPCAVTKWRRRGRLCPPYEASYMKINRALPSNNHGFILAFLMPPVLGGFLRYYQRENSLLFPVPVNKLPVPIYQGIGLKDRETQA
jgi:hypothetical protein